MLALLNARESLRNAMVVGDISLVHIDVSQTKVRAVVCLGPQVLNIGFQDISNELPNPVHR